MLRINKLRTKVICVFDEDEGGRIEVYRPSDSKYQIYLEIYNNNKNKIKYYG